jgi:dCMP deaminase
MTLATYLRGIGVTVQFNNRTILDGKEIDLYMEFAAAVANRSRATRLKVGAIIAHSNGDIVSYGWNGTPIGYPNECEYMDDEGNTYTKVEVVHAEMNAILKAARAGKSCDGAWLFITHLPCDGCIKHIVQSGISYVVYGEHYASKSNGNATGQAMMKHGRLKLIDYSDKKEIAIYVENARG